MPPENVSANCRSRRTDCSDGRHVAAGAGLRMVAGDIRGNWRKPCRTRMESFAGKVAFVTGAANGIGRAAAQVFAREGANVVLADLSEEGNQEPARLVEKAGRRTLTVKCDVSRAEDVRAALDKTAETFGRLDF